MRLRSIMAVKRFYGYNRQRLTLNPAQGRFAVTYHAVEINVSFHSCRRDAHDTDDIPDVPGTLDFLFVMSLDIASCFIYYGDLFEEKEHYQTSRDFIIKYEMMLEVLFAD